MRKLAVLLLAGLTVTCGKSGLKVENFVDKKESTLYVQRLEYPANKSKLFTQTQYLAGYINNSGKENLALFVNRVCEANDELFVDKNNDGKLEFYSLNNKEFIRTSETENQFLEFDKKFSDYKNILHMNEVLKLWKDYLVVINAAPGTKLKQIIEKQALEDLNKLVDTYEK